MRFCVETEIKLLENQIFLLKEKRLQKLIAGSWNFNEEKENKMATRSEVSEDLEELSKKLKVLGFESTIEESKEEGGFFNLNLWREGSCWAGDPVHYKQEPEAAEELLSKKELLKQLGGDLVSL